ncbi:hypothetical protein V8G54_026583 [Vigna mungo]|uniref:Uncharacterized protein n=1 Tax=Vigna mungo TaxID=3915 RepID=A0AAQ3RQ14_VIGMU
MSLTLQIRLQNIHNRPKISLHFLGWVSIATSHVLDFLRVVINLGLGELQAMSSANHHSPISGFDNPSVLELDQCRQSNPSMGANKHPGGIRLHCSIHQLLLRRLLHNPIATLNGMNSPINGNRVTNLNGRGKGGGGYHRLKVLPPRLKVLIQRIGICSLSTNKPWDLVHKSKLLAHLKTFVKGINVAKIPTRHYDPIRNLPIKLLQNLNGSSLLPLQPQTVEGVSQIDRQLSSDFSNQLHAPIKISVDTQHKGAIGNGLNKLGKRDSISRQKHNGRNPCRSAIRGQRCRCVTGGSAADTNDGAVHFSQAIDLANENGHAEILETAGVAYSAVFDP